MTPKLVLIIDPKKPKVDSFRYDEGEVPPVVPPEEPDEEQDTAPPNPNDGNDISQN